MSCRSDVLPAVIWRPSAGPHATLRDAAAAAGRADLVVLLDGVEPFGDWLERLTRAAHADTAIASASAMLSRGPLAPSPIDDPRAAAAAVAARAARTRPRISEPQPGCVLLRRDALDLAGTPQDAWSPAAALADFGERCTALGLAHVLADDVLAEGAPVAPSDEEAAALDTRHPHRATARLEDARPASPIEHALLLASRGLDKLSVTLDARALGAVRAGTHVHALELIAALGRTGRLRLRVVTPPDLDPTARAALTRIDDIELLDYARATKQPPPTDVVHRPLQVFTADDLALLLPLGLRLVVTHQDLIAYRSPSYHDAPELWGRYRRVTRATLGVADHVVFFSEHALADALADELVDPTRASVVPIGVDHSVLAHGAIRPVRPARLPVDDIPYLLCLGADLPHKNHPFAVRLAAALRAGHGWAGRVVLAGPPSAGDPQAGAVRLGSVSEAEKAWLLAHAAAVAYPTLYEGFGLVPFEAAAAGTPCLFAAQTALAEVAPGLSTLVPWDAEASAAAVAPLLSEGPVRTAHVAALRTTGAAYRWDDAARALVELYERVIAEPQRELHRAPRERLLAERRLAESERLRNEDWQRHLAFREAIGEDGLGLVGPGGVLDAADQRALLALLSRPALRRPATAAARLAHKLALRLRRNDRGPSP